MATIGRTIGQNCFASGLPQEEVVKRTVFHFYMYKQEVLIREMIGNVYLECKGFGKNISLSKEQQLALQTEEFMKRRYEFRYNTQIARWNIGKGFLSVFVSILSTNGR